MVILCFRNHICCNIAIIIAILCSFANGGEKTIPLLSLQKSKIKDNTGNVRVADRNAMADVLREYLTAAGFQILEEEMMLQAIKENDKAYLTGGMQTDKQGDKDKLTVPRYFLQLSIEKCDYVKQGNGRVFKMLLRLSATDAHTGKSVAVVENQIPSTSINAREGIDKCIEDIIPRFITAMPERFRPEPLSGSIINVSFPFFIIETLLLLNDRFSWASAFAFDHFS